MIIFILINLAAAMTYFGILPAMILARSGNDKMVWAMVHSMMGVGGVVGSLLVSTWGVPKKKVLTILITTAASFLFGDILFAAGRTVFFWAIAGFLSSLFIPFMLGAREAIWQSKVDPEIQGRIFSVKGMSQTCLMPIGFVLGGFLADYVFEPAMANPTLLSRMFSWLVGTGKGSGMALMFFFTSILGLAIAIFGYFNKEFLYLEDNIADHDYTS